MHADLFRMNNIAGFFVIINKYSEKMKPSMRFSRTIGTNLNSVLIYASLSYLVINFYIIITMLKCIAVRVEKYMWSVKIYAAVHNSYIRLLKRTCHIIIMIDT